MKLYIFVRLAFYILSLTLSFGVYGQAPGEWTWMAGSNSNCNPVYGTQGVPSPLNTPGNVYEAACWTDNNGDFWLFGGWGESQNMWKYDVSTNTWTWMNGPGTGSTGSPFFDFQGVFSSNVIPACTLTGQHAEWVDNFGNLWLLCIDAILGYPSLYKYSTLLNQWAWIHGNIPTNYGVSIGLPDPLINPSITESPISWVDDNGDLWLYNSIYSTIMKFNITSNMWTRMHGDGNPNGTNILGIIGQYSSTNRPISGFAYQHWKSDDGTFYFYGNTDANLQSENKMWQFNPNINEWRVVHVGDANNIATFTTSCTFSSSNHPSNLLEQRTSWKDDCNRFYGIDEGSGGYIWCFDPAINQYSLLDGALSSWGNSVSSNFGVLNVSSSFNSPGGILPGAIAINDIHGAGSPFWTDNSGNFWKAGTGLESEGGTNSLWRYVPDLSCIGGTVSSNFTPSPQQGCAPLAVNFQPQDTSSILSFHWDFGDIVTGADTSIVASPNYTFVTPGTYTVQLIVNGAGSCGSGTDTTELQITVVDPPVLALSNDTTICQGSSVSLSVSGANSYSWSPVLGLNTTVGASVLASPTSSTMYTVSGTTFGCVSTDSVFVNINSLPVLTISDTTICSGDTVTISVNGAATYSWSPSNGLSATTGDSVLASPVSTSTYSVYGTDLNGCVNSEQVIVSVEIPNVTVNSGTLCLNDLVASLVLNANGAYSYSWSPALGLSSSTGNNISCTTTASTIYTVTGTTISGCIDSAQAIVSVVPFFDVMVNSESICSGESTLLTASGADSYTWSPSTGLNAITGTEVSSSPTQTTVYTVTGTINGCSDNAQSTVTVVPTPNAVINVNPNPVSITNPVVVFTTQANENTLIWSQDGEFLSSLETFTHEFTEDQPGSYLFDLVLTNDLGCSDTAYITVIVQDDILFYVPNTFTPDGNEFNQVFQPILTSGIDLASYELEIYNRWEKRIYQTNNTQDFWDGTFKGEMCQVGTYSWKITFNSKYNSKRFEYVGHVNLVR